MKADLDREARLREVVVERMTYPGALPVMVLFMKPRASRSPRGSPSALQAS
jgi:hypothetical protein